MPTLPEPPFNIPTPSSPTPAGKNPYLPEKSSPTGPAMPSVGPRPGEGFDIPDPFSGEPQMPPKTTQPKPLIASPDIIPPTPLAPPVFQQMAPQKQEGRRWVLVTLGAFIAVLLIGVVVFIAIRLLSEDGSQVAIPSFSPVVVQPTVTPTEVPVVPTLTPTPAGGVDDVADPDSDNLTNAEERFYGTESTNADTDGDSYKDGEEVRNGYNPLGEGKLDTDNDGFPDPDERKFGSDPFNPDTDGDGYSDGDEITKGHNPLISAPNDEL